MSTWSQLILQERSSVIIQLLSSFHDYTIAIIMMIIVFVTGISAFMISNKILSDTPIVTQVEIIWTTIPIVILIILAIPSLNILYYSEENDPFITLKINGHQWYWSYEFIDLELEFDSYMLPSPWKGEYRLLDTFHRVVLPTNKDIRGLVTARDVLHCWTIPRLGVKADAVPGRLNQIFINIIRPAIMFGQCSEICGANHRFMPITVERITPKKFFEWCNSL